MKEYTVNEFLPSGYVYIEDSDNIIDTRIYTDIEAKQYLKQLNPNTIFSASISVDMFEYFNFYKVKYNVLPTSIDTVEDELSVYEKYLTRNFSVPYYSNNEWIVDVYYTIDTQKLQEQWDIKRKERNTLLSNTDWIETSTIISDATKTIYQFYRQILRDSPGVVQYPHQIIFPDAPLIKYNEAILDSGTYVLTSEEIDYLKNYRPENNSIKWLNFLVLWKSYNFTNKKQFVANLIQVQTDLQLESILNETSYNV